MRLFLLSQFLLRQQIYHFKTFVRIGISHQGDIKSLMYGWFSIHQTKATSSAQVTDLLEINKILLHGDNRLLFPKEKAFLSKYEMFPTLGMMT